MNIHKIQLLEIQVKLYGRSCLFGRAAEADRIIKYHKSP